RPLDVVSAAPGLHIARAGPECEPQATGDVPVPRGAATFCRYSTANGLARGEVRSVYVDSGGHVQIGMVGPSVSEYDGHRFLTRLAGKSSYAAADWFAEDVDGNLWASTMEGAIRMAKSGFVTFGLDDGLPPQVTIGASEDRSGALYAWTQ